MKFGIHASLGVGFAPTGNDYIRIAQQAEEFGYHSIWVGDHIVVPEKIEATYPYTPDGSVGFDRRTPWPDPFALLAGIGVATRKILLGTSVVIVPYRNPLHVAKAVATVDLLSNPHPPIFFGGESAAAMKRIADLGDGWLPGPIAAEVFQERVEQLKALLAERGRNFSELYISMTGDPKDLKQHPDRVAELEASGVQEIIIFLTAPDTDGSLRDMESIAQAFIA